MDRAYALKAWQHLFQDHHWEDFPHWYAHDPAPLILQKSPLHGVVLNSRKRGSCVCLHLQQVKSSVLRALFLAFGSSSLTSLVLTRDGVLAGQEACFEIWFGDVSKSYAFEDGFYENFWTMVLKRLKEEDGVFHTPHPSFHEKLRYQDRDFDIPSDFNNSILGLRVLPQAVVVYEGQSLDHGLCYVPRAIKPLEILCVSKPTTSPIVPFLKPALDWSRFAADRLRTMSPIRSTPTDAPAAISLKKGAPRS